MSLFFPLTNLEPKSYSIPYMGIHPSRHRSLSSSSHHEHPPCMFHAPTPIYAPDTQCGTMSEAYPTVVQHQLVAMQQAVLELPLQCPPQTSVVP
jgi:hypothetical protein